VNPSGKKVFISEFSIGEPLFIMADCAESLIPGMEPVTGFAGGGFLAEVILFSDMVFTRSAGMNSYIEIKNLPSGIKK
jgi:hypothetical protein